MKTIVSLLVMIFSIRGYSRFAQTEKSVSFQIVNIPAKQGKILLATANGKQYGMTDATASAVKINLNSIPCGKHTI